ncbi:MAG TPA: nitrilase-related carbon-nitrogen hydrolase, partial [Rhodothermales bacterium]|nr:nitrilase-related carbon-nitrogen hydrolase [Rhodothermales bacterium]
MSSSLPVGLVQMRMGEDPAENTDRAEGFIRQAATRGARVVCLPELFRSPYFCKTEDHDLFALAEPVPGPTTARFEGLARELDVTVLVSLFEKRAEGLYHNTLAVVRPDGYAGKYRKMHIPDDPLFYEKFYFTPGDLGFKVFDVPDGVGDPVRVGTLVCWDQWYPEAARLTAMQGAAVLFYPTAIGWMAGEEADHAAQHEAWELIQRS